MRAIYAQADNVIVWIGEAFEDGDKALESIHCFAANKALGLESEEEKKKKDCMFKIAGSKVVSPCLGKRL